MRAPDWISRVSSSLALTGVADAWAALREHAAARSERSGLLLMVASAASFALMGAVAKLMLPDTPTQAIVLSRGVLMTVFCATLAARRRVSILGSRPGMLLVRGLLGYAAVSCYFHSVRMLPLGDAVLLQYSHPVFVVALAPLILGERGVRGQWIFVAAALAGVALIVGPSGELRGSALVGLSGALLSGLAYITVRELSRTEHPLTILIWFPLATIPGALLGTWIAGREAVPRSGGEMAGHLAVFACALAGQVALTQGLARAGAARATAVSMSGPVFGLVFGFLFFGTTPSAASLAGTALVVGALWRLARAPYASRS